MLLVKSQANRNLLEDQLALPVLVWLAIYFHNRRNLAMQQFLKASESTQSTRWRPYLRDDQAFHLRDVQAFHAENAAFLDAMKNAKVLV